MEDSQNTYSDFPSGVAELILKELEPIINEVNSKWRETGESLGFDDELENFNCNDDKAELFRQVITKWVEKSLGINMWPPLLEILGTQTSNANVISELKQKYCRVLYDATNKRIQGHNENDDETEFNGRQQCHRIDENDDETEFNCRQLCHHSDAIGVSLCDLLMYLLLAIAIGWMCYNYRAIERDDLQTYMDDNPMDSNMWQKISARPLIILVTGKTGTGKSTLINGLIGKNVSKEGESLKPETTEVAYFQRIVNGVPMKVFDSPGLQDGTNKEHEYIQDMSEKCNELDLILYTIKMTDARMHNDDVRAMRKLTVAFGEEFWSKAMITLTFANEVQVPAEPGTLDYERNYKKFQTKMQLWNDTLLYVLNNTLGVSSDIVNEVPIVPAGYYKVQHLPGRRYWFSEFWKTALNRMKENNEDRARFMLEYSKNRWQKVYESTPDDFEEDIDKQRIYENKERKGWFSW